MREAVSVRGIHSSYELARRTDSSRRPGWASSLGSRVPPTTVWATVRAFTAPAEDATFAAVGLVVIAAAWVNALIFWALAAGLACLEDIRRNTSRFPAV